MVNKKALEKAFSSEPKNSKPLEEALKPQEVPEYTEEDMELAGMGFALNFVDLYKKRFEKYTVLHQGFPTNPFFDYYLEQCGDEGMLDALKAEKHKFRENQQTKLEAAKEIVIIKEKSTIAEYIEYNAKLIKENQELKEELNFAKENRMIEHIKMEKYKENLKWLYEFMPNMDFVDILGVLKEVEKSTMANKRTFKEIIEKYMYKPTKDDIQKITEIEEMVKDE